MIFLVLFLVVYWLLYQTNQLLRSQISTLSLLITKSTSPGLYLYLLLLFPGTILHELSHALTATILRVRVGHISLFPHQNQNSDQITLGSVAIAKTDFIRSTLIGMSPTVFGTIAILMTIWALNPEIFSFTSLTNIPLNNLKNYQITPKVILSYYLIFSFAGTLHTSKSDRRSWPVFFIFLFLLFISSSLFINTFHLALTVLETTTSYFRVLFLGFVFATLINFTILLILNIASTLLSHLTHRKVVRV